MEDIMTDIRRAVIDEEAGAMVLPTAETKQATGRNPEAGLLSREATAAVGSAFSTLTETVKKHEPTLEDVVRETLRPDAEVVAGRKSAALGRADGAGGNRACNSRSLIFFAPRGGFAAIFVSKLRQSGAGQRALPLPRWQIDRPEDAGWSCTHRRRAAPAVATLSREGSES